MDKDHSISHGDPEFFSLSHARDKTKNIFLNSLPSSKLTISTISKGHCVTVKNLLATIRRKVTELRNSGIWLVQAK